MHALELLMSSRRDVHEQIQQLVKVGGKDEDYMNVIADTLLNKIREL